MKAVVKIKRTKGMQFKEVPVPRIGPRDVLIKVKLTSICGTDVHIHDWTRWAQHRFAPPRIIGHEFVGNVTMIVLDAIWASHYHHKALDSLNAVNNVAAVALDGKVIAQVDLATVKKLKMKSSSAESLESFRTHSM